MNFREKAVYHQIHPVKLCTDISTAFISRYLLWKRKGALALVVMFVPSVCASFILIRYVDLETYKRSRFGRYIRANMTQSMEMLRFAGMAVMAIGAWYHRRWLISLGLLVVLVGWLRGILVPTAE
jgi:hypothetical protein